MKKLNAFMMSYSGLALLLVSCVAQQAAAQTYQPQRAAFMRKGESDRGFHFNNLQISPFVNLQYKYDSNVDTDSREYSDSSFSVNPGVDLKYVGNNWGLKGNAFYGYEWYHDYEDLDAERYGESLQFWAESEKGWKFVLGQRYLADQQTDSILDGGRGIWRDREQFDVNSALDYKISELHGIRLAAAYSSLDYKRTNGKYVPMYGWDEWTATLELSRKISEKSNFLVSGGIQSYESDGATRGTDSRSMGYNLMAGIGSRATERITYRMMTGASFFDYAKSEMETGWRYSVDVNWLINRKLAFSLAGSSYFQPSEREQNQAQEVYTLSGGLTYRPFRKLSTSFDLAYRREEDQYGQGDTDDQFSTRLRADYDWIRTRDFSVDLYASVEYLKRYSDDSYYEYDRFVGMLGMRIFY